MLRPVVLSVNVNDPREIISNADIEGALSLRELGTFLAVARAGSALRAAAGLGYAQSTVTLHLQNLERSLGVALFERIGKRLVLTDAGRLLVEEGRSLLDHVESLRARVHGVAAQSHGSVALGATEPVGTFRLPAILAAFRRRFPEIHVSLHSGHNVATVDRLRRGEVDFVVCGQPRDRDARLEFTPLFEERLVALVPADHRLASRAQVRLRDLAGGKLLVTEESCAYRMLIEAAIEAGELEVALDATFAAVMSLPHGVAGGLGIALVPATAVASPPPGTVAIPLVRPVVALPIGVLRRKNAPEAAAVAKLRSFIESELRGVR